jgi:uncharacterized membrane protein
VFAIAVTLLVLDLPKPAGSTHLAAKYADTGQACTAAIL